MPEPAENRIEIREFPGLMQTSDSFDLAPGAAREQTNMDSARPGELNCRRGFREVTFEG